MILEVNQNNQNLSLFSQQIHAFVDPPTCTFVSSDSPSGLNFTCSIWYSTYSWHPRLYIKGPRTERYIGDPGVRALSQEVQQGHERMVYECGAVFEWSDFPDYARNSRYDQTNLPVITETCSNEVQKNNSYTISSQVQVTQVKANIAVRPQAQTNQSITKTFYSYLSLQDTVSLE